jgi:hypothetical protein
MVVIEQDLCESDVYKIDLFEAQLFRNPRDFLMCVMSPWIVRKRVAIRETVMGVQPAELLKYGGLTAAFAA